MEHPSNFRCVDIPLYVSETAVEEPAIETPEQQHEEITKEKKKEKEKPDLDKENAENTGAPPPNDGKCKICGLERKLNRHKICYYCFVQENLKDWAKATGNGWQVGDPHPSWCDCSGLGEHKNGDGTSRGMN